MKPVFLALVIAITVSCTNSSDHKIMKHPLDKSKARKIVLDNQLKVFLLSDPDFNISAASLSIRAGSLDNPDSRMGLAHFIEHMFKMGTKKYPDLDEFNTYLSSNGGHYNAYTARDHTNYQFQIFPHAMEGALERFSDRFVSPLFPEKYVTKEVNAVNSEHQKNIMNDYWRLFRISSFLSREGHPAKKFQTGNLETLGDVTRDEVISFFEKHYSANQMALSVLSTQPLDEMEGWVRKYFSLLPNRELDKPIYPSDVYERAKTFRLVTIEPVKDIREMNISFSLTDLRKDYKSKPSLMLGYILGNEGKGSLLSYLKDKGWATSLSAGASSETDSYGYATARIGLTPVGLENYREIIKGVLMYISLMQKEGYKTGSFDELKTMAELEEIYSNKGEGANRAVGYANETLFYPLEDAGRVSYIYADNGSQAYQRLLTQLTPDNMMVFLMSKGLETNKKEYFYQAPYAYDEDGVFYQELLDISAHSDLLMKSENPFIPKSAKVPDRDLDDKAIPELIVDTKGEKIYFGQDNEFLRPKGVITYKIFFSKEKMSPAFMAKLKFYIACVNESLNELAYPAKEAGLNYNISDGYEGVFITISGYRESSIVLLKTMINHLITPDINEEQFSGIKDRIIREYQNFHLSDAWRITRDQTERIFRNVYYSTDELYQNAAEITLKDISSFAGEIYQQAFIEGLVYGDYSKEEAKESLQILKQGLKNQAISKEAAFQVKYLQQTESEKIQAVQKTKVNNSCFWREYYLGVDNPVNRAISLIISGAIDRPFFTEMRTNQQLGYIVWSGTQRREDAQYLFFIIQSGVYPADELNKRANEYINQLPDLVSGLTPEMFEKYRQAAIDVLEKKPKSIFERAIKHKDIVFEFDADFERDQKTINALRGIEQSTVVNVLEVAIGEPSKKMVNSLGFAKDHMNESKLQSNYDDIKSWKKSRVYR